MQTANAEIFKNFAGRWYFTSRAGVSDSNWASRSQAAAAARKAGFAVD